MLQSEVINTDTYRENIENLSKQIIEYQQNKKFDKNELKVAIETINSELSTIKQDVLNYDRSIEELKASNCDLTKTLNKLKQELPFYQNELKKKLELYKQLHEVVRNATDLYESAFGISAKIIGSDQLQVSFQNVNLKNRNEIYTAELKLIDKEKETFKVIKPEIILNIITAELPLRDLLWNLRKYFSSI